MLNLKPALDRPLRILCLGAHCDDIEIGCGATILRITKEHLAESVKWVVFTSTVERREEAILSGHYFSQHAASSDVVVLEFKDAFLPQQSREVKEYFEKLKGEVEPDLIFTHYRNDLHQDHRLINALTWNTFRNHLILEYEIFKYDGDIGQPSVYAPVPDEVALAKVDALVTYFRSQAGKHWFDRETFLSLMRLRGVECVSRYAEAFYTRKLIV